MKNSDIMVSVPDQVKSSTTDLFLQSRPLSEVDLEDFGEYNVVSEMITLMPHHSSFDHHLLVSFPLQSSKVDPCDCLDLWYCDGLAGKRNEWVNISRNTSHNEHQDNIFWFIKGFYCYVFMKTFCHLVVTKGDINALELCACVHGWWKQEHVHKLVLTVGFHCNKCNSKCNEMKLTAKEDVGVFIDYRLKYIYDDSGPVNVTAAIEEGSWRKLIMTKKIEASDLLAQCSETLKADPQLYTEKFTYISKEDVDGDTEVYGTITIHQDKRTESTIEFSTQLKSLLPVKKEEHEDVQTSKDTMKRRESLLDHRPMSATVKTIKKGSRKHQVKCEWRKHGVSVITPFKKRKIDLSKALKVPSTRSNKVKIGEPSVKTKSMFADDKSIKPMSQISLKTDDSQGKSSLIPESETIPFKVEDPEDAKADLLFSKFEGSKTGDDDKKDVTLNLSEAQSEESTEGEIEVTLPRPDITDGVQVKLSDDQNNSDLQGRALLDLASKSATNVQHIHIHQYNGGNGLPTAFHHWLRIQAQEKIENCVFNPSIRFEQNILCDTMDTECRDRYGNIARAMGYINGNLHKDDITAYKVLQVWKTFVESKRHSWKQFFEILIEHQCQKSAQKLKVVYEKDKLLGELCDLKQWIPIKDISAALVTKGVITVAERKKIMETIGDEEAVEYLVLDLLIQRDQRCITDFHKILYEKEYLRDTVLRLVLCPEDLT